MFIGNPKHQPNGFAMSFEHGWTVSVQWGRGNYGSNRFSDMDKSNPNHAVTAEVLITAPDGTETAKGWQSEKDVIEILMSVVGVRIICDNLNLEENPDA